MAGARGSICKVWGLGLRPEEQRQLDGVTLSAARLAMRVVGNNRSKPKTKPPNPSKPGLIKESSDWLAAWRIMVPASRNGAAKIGFAAALYLLIDGFDWMVRASSRVERMAFQAMGHH
jgi:hypothetical protein